jgi:hypothetical protein
MSDFIFSSTNPQQYNTIICPLNNTVKEAQWYVKQLVGVCYIKLLDPDDYLIINHHRIVPNKTYFKINKAFFDWFENELSAIGISFEIDDGFRFTFYSRGSIHISQASYYFKQILGLYNTPLPLRNRYCLSIESSGIITGSSLWYLLSNNGSSCVINHSHRDFYCFVCGRIFNNFEPCKSFKATNTDFKSVCLNLSSLTIKVVDENFEPVRFTSPLHIYIHIDNFNRDNDIPFEPKVRPVLKNKININEKIKEIEQDKPEPIFEFSWYYPMRKKTESQNRSEESKEESKEESERNANEESKEETKEETDNVEEKKVQEKNVIKKDEDKEETKEETDNVEEKKVQEKNVWKQETENVIKKDEDKEESKEETDNVKEKNVSNENDVIQLQDEVELNNDISLNERAEEKNN